MEAQKGVNVTRVVIMLLLVLVVLPLLPILISGRWYWWEAWVMTAVFILAFIVSRGLAAHKNPGILKERANYNQHENTQPWDKWLSPLVAYGSVFILLVAGLDAVYHWSAGFPLPVEMVGLVLILAGYVLASYALIENAYFSGTVRIQEERGHKVVSMRAVCMGAPSRLFGQSAGESGHAALAQLGLGIHSGDNLRCLFHPPHQPGRPLLAGEPGGIS